MDVFSVDHRLAAGKEAGVKRFHATHVFAIVQVDDAVKEAGSAHLNLASLRLRE